jgi:hypothetical protein
MKQSQIERTYQIAPHALFGACLIALGYMRAQIEQHDLERGSIVAVVGGGPLAVATELSLRITPIGAEHARLVATGAPRKRGGDRRALAVLVESVDRLLAQA